MRQVECLLTLVIRMPCESVRATASATSADAAYDRLCADGVAFGSSPADQEWGMHHAWLRDPDGYRLSISSPNMGAG